MNSTNRFDQPVREFLAYLQVEAGLASATLSAYASDLAAMVQGLLDRGISGPGEVEPRHLAEHVQFLHRDRGLQPSSIARHLSTMRMFYRYLEGSGTVESNPTAPLSTPTRWKRLPGVLTPKQMKSLLDAADETSGRLWRRDRAMLELMYAAGLRASEVAGLLLDGYDERIAVLRVMGKGSKERLVPIGDPARRAVAAKTTAAAPPRPVRVAARVLGVLRARGHPPPDHPPAAAGGVQQKGTGLPGEGFETKVQNTSKFPT